MESDNKLKKIDADYRQGGEVDFRLQRIVLMDIVRWYFFNILSVLARSGDGVMSYCMYEAYKKDINLSMKQREVFQ